MTLTLSTKMQCQFLSLNEIPLLWDSVTWTTTVKQQWTVERESLGISIQIFIFAPENLYKILCKISSSYFISIEMIQIQGKCKIKDIFVLYHIPNKSVASSIASIKLIYARRTPVIFSHYTKG